MAKNKKHNSALSALGSAGGKIGGRKRAESLSSEERSSIASKAAKARWTKAGLKRRKKSQELHDKGEGKKPE